MLGVKSFPKLLPSTKGLLKLSFSHPIILFNEQNFKITRRYSMFVSHSKQSNSSLLEKYRKSFESDSLDAYITNFSKNILPASFENSPDQILIFLAKQHESPNKESSASIKVQRSLQAIARYLKENSKPKTGNALNLQQKEGLIAFVTLLTHSPGGFYLSLSSEVILNSMANLIKQNKLEFSDLLTILTTISLSERKVFHSKVFPQESAPYITQFLKQNLDKLGESVTVDTLNKISGFVHNFIDITSFKEVFSVLRGNIFLSIKVKIETGVKSTNISSSILDLFLMSLDYLDIYEAQIISLNGQIKSIVKKMHIPSNQKLDYSLKFYKKTIAIEKNIFLGEHLFPLIEEFLSEPVTPYNINLVKLEELQTLGDIIIENKLSIPLIFLLQKSLLSISETQKSKIKLNKKEFIYEIAGDIIQNNEYAELIVENPVNANIMNLKEMITSFFVKFCSMFELKGLLLILYLNLEKFISLGKYESFLFFQLKEKTKTLKESELMSSLTFLKTTTRNKRFLVWFTPFEGIIEKVLHNYSDRKGWNLQQFIELLVKGRKDFVYQDHRSFDIKLDNSMLENFSSLGIKEIEFIMGHIVASKLECNGFFEQTLKYFSLNYETLQLGTSINLLLKFAYLGIKVDQKILDHIVRNFMETRRGKPQFMHVTTPFKLFASLILMKKFDKYEPGLYDGIFEAMMKNWDENYSEIDKEEIFSSNFSNNLLLFLKYVELFHSNYFKSHLLKGKGATLLKLVTTKPKNTFGGYGSKSETEVVSILKKTFPELKLSENGFIFDGLLEYDIRATTPNNRDIFIEYFGPTHFTSNPSFLLLGTSQLILDLKSKLGNILMIPYFEWNELNNNLQKEQYLQEKIHHMLV